MSAWRVSSATMTALFVLGLGACGGADERSVVVRVGDNAITKATVDHWTRIVRRGGAFTGFRGEPHGPTARQRALALLISSGWLIGEASRQGLPVSEQAVRDALRERKQASGEAEFRNGLRATGQTITGVELELRAELALEAIQQGLAGRAEEVTSSEVVDYYRKNPQRFRTPEERVVDIVKKLASPAAATALVRRVGTGKRFARAAYRKRITYAPGVLLGPADKKAVDYAIFAARPGVVSRPMRLEGGWTIFVVRSIIRPRVVSLARAHDSVVALLTQRRQRQITSAFDDAYRVYWTGRTSCRPGYVAPGCAKYRGALEAYEDPFAPH
jgi:foldase protein PrsA